MKFVSNILKKAQGRKFEKELIQFIDFIVIIPYGIIIFDYFEIVQSFHYFFKVHFCLNFNQNANLKILSEMCRNSHFGD